MRPTASGIWPQPTHPSRLAPSTSFGTTGATEPLVASQLAAARAAADIGRTDRARGIYERLFEERASGWTDAALGLAPLLEASGEFVRGREVLDAVVGEAADADVRAFALWALGGLAEKESEAATARAVEAYGRVLEVSDTAFPKTLLEAKMSRLSRGKKTR